MSYHVEIVSNKDRMGDPLHEYYYTVHQVMPPFNKGDTVYLCFRKDENPGRATGKFVIVEVEHFFSKGHGYNLIAYVDPVEE